MHADVIDIVEYLGIAVSAAASHGANGLPHESLVSRAPDGSVSVTAEAAMAAAERGHSNAHCLPHSQVLFQAHATADP